MTKMASSEYMHEGLFGGMQLTDKGTELVHKCGGCKDCPFRGMCEDKELYFSCPVWEDGMAEDL